LSAGAASTLPAVNRFLRWPRWIASLSARRPADIAGFDRIPLERSDAKSSLALYCASDDRPDFAVAKNTRIVFEGVLYNAEELALRFGLADRADDYGAILLRAYEQLGADFLCALRGFFALVLWDGDRSTLIVARDRTGAHPCFYARVGEELLIASSIGTLLDHPRVSKAVNRAAFVDYLADSWPSLRETFYAGINRIPPGCALRLQGADEVIYRHWNPRAVASESDWLAESQAEGFEDLLAAAVDRFLQCAPSAIFLSGGLDSVSVAAVAADLARQQGLPQPLALSMAFRNSEADEEQRQRAVAQQLGLQQEFLGFQDETGGQGFLRPTLALAQRMSAPLLNMWLARYSSLTEIGKRMGCRAILTGTGGDEWLGVAPTLAADMIRGLDFGGLYRLWLMTHNSYEGSWLKQVRLWGWRCGVRAILRDSTITGLKRISPATLAAVRRYRLMNSMPSWVTIDGALRGELGQRIAGNETSRTRDAGPYGSYFAESRLALDHPVVSWELEETFENGRRLGVRFFHPYWDSDLVDLLWRTPPAMLASGGRMKGLVRKVVSRRFPHLGFDKQKKVEVRGLFFSIMANEAPAVWREMGGAKSLAKLGLVDKKRLDHEFEKVLGGRSGTHAEACKLFNVMNMESWLTNRL
jgi:asparagine synthetase B (glutamine-hydrolysing)